MSAEEGPSRATPDGQMIAFVAGLTSLNGRRRAVARLAAGAVLLAGAAAVAFGEAWAFAEAFG